MLPAVQQLCPGCTAGSTVLLALALCRVQVADLQQALEAAHAEHMDYEFLQLQLQEYEAASEQQTQASPKLVPLQPFSPSGVMRGALSTPVLAWWEWTFTVTHTHLSCIVTPCLGHAL